MTSFHDYGGVWQLTGISDLVRHYTIFFQAAKLFSIKSDVKLNVTSVFFSQFVTENFQMMIKNYLLGA